MMFSRKIGQVAQASLTWRNTSGLHSSPYGIMRVSAHRMTRTEFTYLNFEFVYKLNIHI